MTEHTPPSLLLKQFLPYRMVNLAKRISDAFGGVYFEAYDLTIPEWRILARLGEDRRLNSRDIGAITFMDKSKVSRAVKLMDSKGLLLREKDPGDNRVIFLSLTDKGQALYHRIVPRALAWEGELIRGLDLAEYRDLLRIMEKLDRQLDQMDSDDRTVDEESPQH